MTVVDATVLVFEERCSTARAYLTYMSAHGMKPRNVVVIRNAGTRGSAKAIQRVVDRTGLAAQVDHDHRR